VSSLNRYFRSVGQTRLLSREEEVALAQRVEKGDLEAKRLMVESNLKLAIAIAKKFQDKGCDFEDLIQEANMGLLKAVERFQWRLGFKFSTYASWWIRQSVSRHISTHSRTIKMPSHASGLLKRIYDLQQEHLREFGVSLSPEEISEILNVSLNIVEAAISAGRGTVSLHAEVGGDGENSRLVQDTIPDPTIRDFDDDIDRVRFTRSLHQILNLLTPREEKMIRLRFGISGDRGDHHHHPITRKELEALNQRSQRITEP
jgi:RNA polymerase primary sigma factor